MYFLLNTYLERIYHKKINIIIYFLIRFLKLPFGRRVMSYETCLKRRNFKDVILTTITSFFTIITPFKHILNEFKKRSNIYQNGAMVVKITDELRHMKQCIMIYVGDKNVIFHISEIKHIL